MSSALPPQPWLRPRAPLDNTPLPSGARFAIVDAPPAERFVFRGGEAARAACSAVFRVELPIRLGPAGQFGERTALWLGPDEWLLMTEGQSEEGIAAAFEAGLEGEPHSLVDVSHRQIGLEVTGALAARALSAGCPLDLRLRTCPVGMATRTLFDKAEIVLWRRGESQFRVEVARSLSPWLAAALIEAARGAPEF
jgi:sarcosine oxidase subunit gamma